MKRVVYLACPYTHTDPFVREARFVFCARFAASILKHDPDCVVYSPITHSHPIAVYGNLKGDYDFWKAQCLHFLPYCTEMIVLNIEGWKESVGVQDEIKQAAILEIPIEHISTEQAVALTRGI